MQEAWYSLTQPFGQGSGYQETFTGVNPAAGASFSLNLSGKYRHRLTHALWTLTTDGNAANRYVTLQLLGGDTNPVWINAAAVTVSANSTQRFVGDINRGNSEWATNTDVLFPLSPMFLDGGLTLKINVGGIQVGDTLTLIRFTWEKYTTNPEPQP
jgi:hypothetical protein